MINENPELILRIRELESFKEELGKKLAIVWWVATALGAASIIGGTWVNNLYGKLELQAEELKALDSELTRIEDRVSDTSIKLRKESVAYVSQLNKEGGEIIATATEKLNALLDEKKKEIRKIGTSDLIGELQNGSVDLSLKSLSIVNRRGLKIIKLEGDSGGDGVLSINSELGKLRYSIKLSNDNAVSSYYNSDGKGVLYVGAAADDGGGLFNVVNPSNNELLLQVNGANNSGNIKLMTPEGEVRYWLTTNKDRPYARFYNDNTQAVVGIGAFSDGERGFMRIFDPTNDETVVEVSSNNEGGRSFFYTQDGKQLVYVGPAANTGDALVKLNSRFGSKTKDLSP